MFFKNLQAYRLPRNWAMTSDALASALSVHSFAPASSNELIRQGWQPPRPNGGLVHAVGRQFLIMLQTEKKLLPATVINQVTKARAEEMEEAQGFMPGKKAMKELKERVTDELLPRAFSIIVRTFCWIDPVNGWLVVDAASPSKADDVVKLLLKSVDRMPLESLRVQRSPVGVMTEWLQADESPAGFTVDMDATLRAAGESKAQVAFKRSLDVDDVRRHIASGKQCTRLAMTWDSKISFVLDESLAIKSIKPLDIITERESITKNDEERFDSEFTLMAAELAKLMADLVEALGGEAIVDAVNTKTHDEEPAKGDEAVREQRPVASIHDQVAAGLRGKGITLSANSDVPDGDGSASDPLYDQAVTIVRANDRASISLIQRHLRIGYNRAARLLEAMEGIVVGRMQSDGKREILAQGGAV